MATEIYKRISITVLYIGTHVEKITSIFLKN